jgi:hypothetical protein
MFGRMFAFRRVATSNVAAFQTQSQMHPRVTRFNAIFANVLIRARSPNLTDVSALCHGALHKAKVELQCLHFRQRVMNQLHRYFADYGSDVLQFPVST